MDKSLRVKKFRESSKRKRTFKLSGNQHLVGNLLFAFCVMLFSFISIGEITWSLVFLFPVAIMFGTLVEYLGHRFLLHVQRSFFKVAYQEHTLSHHFYFTNFAIEMEHEEDFHFVLFNFAGLAFFVLLIGGGLSLLVGYLAGQDFGFFFMGLCGLYFLIYELLHTSFHLKINHPVLRNKWIRHLRDHHLAHHDQAIMGTHNFGIVTTFWDAILGTKFKPL